MNGSRYEADIDLSNRNNSHTLMADLVGGSKRVLDVGCATGYLARVLREQGCTVTGLEHDREAAEEARPHLDRLIVGDLETLDLLEAVGDERFDVIVFGDVLEHLRDPLAVLRSARGLLAERGSVVASIPNVAHGSVRLALLAGRFDYQPLGLLDSTHVRFYTRASVEELFRGAGMAPVDVRRTTAGFFDTPLPVAETEFPGELVDAVRADPEASTYQFVLRAVPDDAEAAVFKLSAELDTHRAMTAKLAGDLAAVRGSEQAALSRAEEAEKRSADLEARLVGVMAELGRVGGELEAVLATRTMRWTSSARSVYGRLRGVFRDG